MLTPLKFQTTSHIHIYIYISLMLYVRTKIPRTAWIRSNIALEVGFPDMLCLANIPYSVLIRYFLNSWPVNFYPWWYVISFGQGHMVNHIVLNKFVVGIPWLLSYYVIWNHLVTVSIILMALRFSSLVGSPSSFERSYKRCTCLHIYGESTVAQEIFHLRAIVNTKDSLEDEKDEKCWDMGRE